MLAEFVGQTPGLRPGLRGSPGPALSFEEPRLSTTARGRRGLRPRSRGSAPRLRQVLGYRKSMRHYARVHAPPLVHLDYTARALACCASATPSRSDAPLCRTMRVPNAETEPVPYI